MEKSTIKNGKKEKRRRIAEKCLTNGPLFDIIPKSLVRCKFGPVVQSVSTPACHAGGRRFESVPGRQICGCSSSGRAPPCQGGGSEFEPRHPLQKITDTIRCLLFFYPGRGSKNQGSMSIVGVEAKRNNFGSCRSESSGTIFMYCNTEFYF